MAGPKITLALEHYDRTAPLFEGKVKADGIDLEVVLVGNHERRDQRFLDGYPWDAAEISLTPYMKALAGGAAITGIPVFHRRFMTPSHMYVNKSAGIKSPQDLRGRRVGVANHNLALPVWARGDLEHDYGVKLSDVTWVSGSDEPVPYPPAGVHMEKAPRNVDEMLVAGEIDALFNSMLPKSFESGAPQVGRLFADSRAEDKAYYKRNGFYPVIHCIAIKKEVVDRYPGAAMSIYQALDKAQEVGINLYYKDPWWSHLVWTHMELLEQRDSLGAEAWANGIACNRSCIERFCQYLAEQGLVGKKYTVEEMFAEETMGT